MPKMIGVRGEMAEVRSHVVARVPVDVVDDLRREEVATQASLDDETMLRHVPMARGKRMVREVPIAVAPNRRGSTAPRRIIETPLSLALRTNPHTMPAERSSDMAPVCPEASGDRPNRQTTPVQGQRLIVSPPSSRRHRPVSGGPYIPWIAW